jgi:hypothetical protein
LRNPRMWLFCGYLEVPRACRPQKQNLSLSGLFHQAIFMM